MNQVISLHKATGKSCRLAMKKSRNSWRCWIQRQWNQSACGVNGQLIRVMAVHEEAIDIERAIVDAEVAACTITRLSNSQNRRITEQGFSTEALHRAAVKVIAAQID